jgi:hypothetical protein
MRPLPTRVVVPPETSLGEEQSVLLLGVLHHVLVIEDQNDPLIEIVRDLEDAGLNERTIASTLSISHRLVEYLQGIQDPEARETWHPREVVQDWATGQTWPMGDDCVELIRCSWNEARDVCGIRVGSVGRQRSFRLPFVSPPNDQPLPPSPDDVAHALGAAGARLFGMAEVVGVRARLGRTGAGVAVLAPFTDIVDQRTSNLLHEQAQGSHALQEIIDIVRSDTGRNAIIERSHAAFVLRVEASSGAERLSREQRQTIAQFGRRVVIAVAEEVGRDIHQASPLSVVMLAAVRTGRWPPDQLTLDSHDAMRALDSLADRAAEAVSRAVESTTARGDAGGAETQLGIWLFEALLMVQGVIESGDLSAKEQRGRVERLETVLEQIVLTHERQEEEERE